MYNAAIVGAYSSLAGTDYENASAIEQIYYLIDKCPTEKKFNHMRLVPIVYLVDSLAKNKMQQEKDWLKKIIKKIREKHKNDFIFEMLNVLLEAPEFVKF